MILSSIEENTRNELFKLNKFKHDDVIVAAPSTTVINTQQSRSHRSAVAISFFWRTELRITTKHYIYHLANVNMNYDG